MRLRFLLLLRRSTEKKKNDLSELTEGRTAFLFGTERIILHVAVDHKEKPKSRKRKHYRPLFGMSVPPSSWRPREVEFVTSMVCVGVSGCEWV